MTVELEDSEESEAKREHTTVVAVVEESRKENDTMTEALESTGQRA